MSFLRTRGIILSKCSPIKQNWGGFITSWPIIPGERGWIFTLLWKNMFFNSWFLVFRKKNTMQKESIIQLSAIIANLWHTSQIFEYHFDYFTDNLFRAAKTVQKRPGIKDLNPISGRDGSIWPLHYTFVCSSNRSMARVTKIGDFISLTI